MHQIDADLLKRSAHWREDIQFTQDVLGKPFHFTSTWGIFSPEKLDEGSLMLLDYIELKDFVAVDYAKRNGQKNHLNNAQVQLSNGFRDVEKDKKFSLVMSNLPAKASKEQHYLYLLDAYNAMESGARFYVVTINGLRDFMKRSFTEVFGNSDKLKQGKTYTITLAVKD